MGDAVEVVSDSLGKAYSMIKKDGERLFKAMIGVNALSMAIGIMGMLIGLGLGLGLLIAIGGYTTAPSANPALALVVVAIVIIIIIGAALLAEAASAVSYNVVDDMASGRKTSIIESFKANIVPVSILEALRLAIIFILALPLILSLLAGGTSAMGLLCGLGALSVVLIIAFSIFIQFSTLEVVLAKKGAIDAMKSSVSLVRANLFAVFLLDLVIFLVALCIGGAGELIRLAIGLIPPLFSVGGSVATVVGYAIYIVLFMVVQLITSAIVETIVTPATYMFWKKK